MNPTKNDSMIDFLKLPSPCYVLDEKLLDANLGTIDRVRRESGAEIIVALKACAMWSVFPELARHSDGATASSAAEARLVFEEFGKPAHTYAPTYTDRNIDEILRCSDHITFNSVSQFERFGQRYEKIDESQEDAKDKQNVPFHNKRLIGSIKKTWTYHYIHSRGIGRPR